MIYLNTDFLDLKGNGLYVSFCFPLSNIYNTTSWSCFFIDICFIHVNIILAVCMSGRPEIKETYGFSWISIIINSNGKDKVFACIITFYATLVGCLTILLVNCSIYFVSFISIYLSFTTTNRDIGLMFTQKSTRASPTIMPLIEFAQGDSPWTSCLF